MREGSGEGEGRGGRGTVIIHIHIYIPSSVVLVGVAVGKIVVMGSPSGMDSIVIKKNIVTMPTTVMTMIPTIIMVNHPTCRDDHPIMSPAEDGPNHL